MPAQAATPPLTTPARIFRAEVSEVRETRRYLASVMGDCPAYEDAVACLSEVVTNSIVHSRSGHGGFLTVQVARVAGRWRVSVGDEGGLWHKHLRNGDGQHNRGLAIVAALAARWQVDGDGLTSRVVWFEVKD